MAGLSFLLFPVRRPELFDAVVTGPEGKVREIQVKVPQPATRWVWGGFKLHRAILAASTLWLERGEEDAYVGTLVNAWLARGSRRAPSPRARAYVDVGTLHGYHEVLEPALGARARAGAVVVRGAEMKSHMSREEIEARIRALGDWFHNLELAGVETAPDTSSATTRGRCGSVIAPALPQDLTGKSVLDIGCNAGFFSIEMKRRGAARVLGLDADPRYLAQARLAAEIAGSTSSSASCRSTTSRRLGERFDVVLFMGVLYHLRHPLLALDLVREHVAKDLLVFQSMIRGSQGRTASREDYHSEERRLRSPG